LFIGIYHEQGRPKGEFKIAWDTPSHPRLNAFDDSWLVLYRDFQDVLKLLSEIGSHCDTLTHSIDIGRFCVMLERLGIKKSRNQILPEQDQVSWYLLFGSSHGSNIPKMFMEYLTNEKPMFRGHTISGKEMRELSDPSNEWYWDSWDTWLNSMEVEVDGQWHSLHHDGNLWLKPISKP